MPLKSFYLNTAENYELTDSFLDVKRKLIRLKGVVDTKQAPASYTYEAEGTVIFPEIVANGLTGLWSFDVIVSPTTADVKFQGSTDGGSTWRGWNGAWASSVWCDLSDFSNNLPSFPVEGAVRRFKVRAKLTRGSNGSSPVLTSPSLSYDLMNFNYSEDLLRTLKHFIEAVEVSLSFLKDLTASTNKVIISTDFTISSVTATYNLTADPLRQTNLFQSFSGNEVTMTASQATGSRIEVLFKGTAPVFITANADIVVTNLPTFIIVADREDEERLTRTAVHVIERRRSAYESRLYIHPPQKRTPIEIRCLHEFNLQALDMASAVDRSCRDAVIPLEFSGEDLSVVDFTPLIGRDEVSEGLFQKAVAFELVGTDWSEVLSTKEEVPLLQTVRLNVGGDTAERSQS